MFQRIKRKFGKLKTFLLETVSGSIIINLTASIFFVILVFLINFVIKKRGADPIDSIAAQILDWIAVYTPYITTVFVTLIVVFLFSILRKVWRYYQTSLQKRVIKTKGITIVPQKGFTGRSQELLEFEAFLQNKTQKRIFFIHGISGSGKSWLIYKLIEKAKNAAALTAYIDFRSGPVPLMTLLNEIVYQLGTEKFDAFTTAFDRYSKTLLQFQSKYEFIDKSLKLVISQEEEKTLSSFLSDLREISKKTKVFICLDTIEKINGTELLNWIKISLLIAIREGLITNVYFVISGWDKINLGSDWDPYVFDRKLSFLNISEIKEVLDLEIGVGQFDAHLPGLLFELTGQGHPLFVGLAATTLRKAKDEGKQITASLLSDLEFDFYDLAVDQLLMNGILKWIPEETTEVIQLCAIPRWFDAGILRDAFEIPNSLKMIEQLRSFESFVRPRRPRGYEYHEIVRDLLINKWKSEDLGKFIQLNEKASEYYAKAKNNVKTRSERENLILELIYHSSIIDSDKALGILRESIEEELVSYNLDFAEQILQQANKLFQNPDAISWLDYYQSQLAYQKGNWEEAERICLRTINIGEPDFLMQALCRNTLGEIYYYQGGLKNAISQYEKSMALLTQDHENYTLYTKISENAAKAYRLVGDLATSEKYHKQALELAKRENKLSRVANISIEIATTYVLQGKWDNAIRVCESGMQIFNQLNDKRSIGRSLRNLAWAQMYKGRWKDAKESSEKALNIAQDIFDNYNVGIGYMNLARILQLQKKWKEGLNNCNQAFKIFERLGAEIDMGNALEGKGSCTRNPTQWQEALTYYQRSIQIFRKLDYKHGLALSLCNLGTRYSELRENSDALVYLRESEEIAKDFQIHYWRAKALFKILEIETSDNTTPISSPTQQILEDLLKSCNFPDLSSTFLFFEAQVAINKNEPVGDDISKLLLSSLAESYRYNDIFFEEVLRLTTELVEGLCSVNKESDAAYITRFMLQNAGSLAPSMIAVKLEGHFRAVDQKLKKFTKNQSR